MESKKSKQICLSIVLNVQQTSHSQYASLSLNVLKCIMQGLHCIFTYFSIGEDGEVIYFGFDQEVKLPLMTPFLLGNTVAIQILYSTHSLTGLPLSVTTLSLY